MRRVILLVAAVAALAAAPARAGGPSMLVGATEDNVKATDARIALANMGLAENAGLDAMRVTEVWFRGQTQPDGHNIVTLSNVATAAKRDHVRILLSVFPYGSSQTPLTPEDRADFVRFTAWIARHFAEYRTFLIGNEPNLNRFWLPQFDADGSDAAAPAYEQLLAQTYDALKSVDPATTVVGGALSPRGADCATCSRQTHSPTRFILDLGAAYRASGRTTPIMDAFSIHPYEDYNRLPPTFAHPHSTTISVADYGKLVSLLGQAFDGTAQRGSTLPVYYTEFGVETTVPPADSEAYTGTEPASVQPVSPTLQAQYYREALQLAYCQPNVRGFFFFHTVDETSLARFQSGLYYATFRPKPSEGVVRVAARAARGGSLARCPGLRLTPSASLSVRTAPQPLGLIRCSLDCTYNALLRRGGRVVARLSRSALAGQLTRVPLPRLTPGRYTLRATVVARVNTGAPRVAQTAFSVA